MDLPFINYFKCPRNHESGRQLEAAYKKVAEKKHFESAHLWNRVQPIWCDLQQLKQKQFSLPDQQLLEKLIPVFSFFKFFTNHLKNKTLDQTTCRMPL